MTRRQDYRLTDAGVKAIAKQSTPTKVTRHGDGNNLYLIQHPNGSLFWQVTYRYQSDKDLKPKQKKLIRLVFINLPSKSLALHLNQRCH